MKKKQTPNCPEDNNENPNEIDVENETPLKNGADICQQLMDRYSKSSAPQHRHLIATAAAMRSILSAESLPLTPPAYFAAAISGLDDDSATTLDSTAIGALLTFLSIVVLVVPKGGIASGNESGGEGGIGSGEFEEWSEVFGGVRRCAQEYLEKVFKLFQSSIVIKEASKLLTVPYLSAKIRLKILSELCKLTSSEFSTLTRNIHKTIEVFFENSNVEAIIPEMENIIVSLASYVTGEKNPVDTLISAATLLKCAVDKFHAVESNSWMKNVPLVCGSLAVILTFEASTTSQASDIMKELINHHIDVKSFSADTNGLGSEEAYAIKSICSIFENALSSSDGLPNEHVLAVLTVLFQKLGESSYIFMKGIVHKLADLMTLASGDMSNTNHLRNCIGSAVTVIGPERILTLLPITLHSDDLIYSNVWLVPVLKDYVVGASLRYYMEHIVPLAKSFQQASCKVKKSVIRQDLQAHAHSLWGLLPAFCRYTIDTHKKFKALAELLIDILKEDSLMHENITVAIQDAVGCLASITDSSITKRIFVSLVEKLQFVDGEGEFEKQAGNANELMEEEQSNLITMGKDASRCVIMELASSLIAGAEEDLIDFIYVLVKQNFLETNEIGHCEAYYALSRILEEHACFCSSRLMELVDLLLGLKSPVDIASLRSRLDCFNMLMVHTLKMSSLEEDMKPFLILNEIIVTLKDGKEEPRKATYEILLKMSSTLRNPSDLRSDSPYHKLISMIMGYLSGSSPHIKSGAVAALSVLVYNDPEICISVPDLVSSILSLLQTKAVEVIKAVLGFVKVLVSSLQAKDLQNFLSGIIHGVLQWSSISRNHFRSKVTIILEIVTRKCGIAAVQLVTPEKHRGFLNTVMENRRSKSTSKEADNDADKVLVDSLTEGSQKRRHKGLGTFKRKIDLVEHRKRRDKRDGGKLSDLSEPGISAASGGRMKMAKRAKHFENSMKGHSDGNGKKKKNFEGSARGHKRKIDQATMSKKGEAADDRHSFKVRRQKKFRAK
ncbi:hypothetical protein CRYUN_Cryun08bG0093900 [Craigia yunnanensis]